MSMRLSVATLGMASLILLSGCANSVERMPELLLQSEAGSNRPDASAYAALGRPYIGGALPGALLLVPPAPEEGDATYMRDVAAADEAFVLKDSARWNLAVSDASLRTGAFGKAFSCAVGAVLDDDKNSSLGRLLSRSASDLAFSTSEVKQHYKRQRPFMVNGRGTCTPDEEVGLRDNGSYPSGHSAIGYGLGLILAEIFSERATELVARGTAFGDSRRICNVHWMSDVEQGRQIAAATVARLHNNTEFLADIEAAKADATMLAALPEGNDCATEQAMLAPMK